MYMYLNGYVLKPGRGTEELWTANSKVRPADKNSNSVIAMGYIEVLEKH